MALQKCLLIVLDGFGDGKDSPFNAIQHAHMPFYREIRAKFPRAQLITSGAAVGLPDKTMGNSEVGHMNMGAGRIVYQELTRINKAIADGEFKRNPEIKATIEAAKKAGGRVHLMGLLSDAGVHSTIEHLKALVELADEKVPVTIHVFTDGRDTPPTSGVKYLRELGEFLRKHSHAVIGSVSGRYYAMDRDKRWDRVKKAWDVIVGHAEPYPYKKGNGCGAALKYVEESYAKQVTDEFIVPTRIEPEAGRGHVEDGDAVIFFNFRSDRARQLTRAFTEEGFKDFDAGKRPKLSRYLCMTQYDKTLGLPVAYPPQNLSHILPDVLAEKGLHQFRIAETEKYAHVTFFFNGGREQPYAGEERVLIPSPKDVATYDLKPEMSAYEVADKLAARLETGKDDFALVNFANADMVGHTGNYDAAVKALAAIDKCLDKVVGAALRGGFDVIITADHGNIEEMRDEHDQPHTQHTFNPVPVHYISKKNSRKLHDGILADVAPTVLDIMGLPKPAEMDRKSLLEGKA
jgi:2,3-bisphosphoglycerate-independent phosphoglycerate mutase